jgi:hypothetical protein
MGWQRQLRARPVAFIWQAGGRPIRSYAVKRESDKAHGVFANPGGLPRRINAAS